MIKLMIFDSIFALIIKHVPLSTACEKAGKCKYRSISTVCPMCIIKKKYIYFLLTQYYIYYIYIYYLRLWIFEMYIFKY